MTAGKRLFLDFDGVLCDSLEECFTSSAIAFHQLDLATSVPRLTELWKIHGPAFFKLRPFIREGAEYLLLHRLLEAGQTPRSQAEFDAELEKAGKATLSRFKDELYRVREELLIHQRTVWLKRNPLYPGLTEELKRLAASQDVHVLSTKKAEFISEILAANGVPWPAERVIYTGSRKKLDIIRQDFSPRSAVLIDDQIDHLDFGAADVDCRLAVWGYVKPEWIPQAGDRNLDLEQFKALLRAHPV